MKKGIILLLVVGVVLLVVFSEGVFAATINATSCEQVDVQAAIDSAVDGDTVMVPADDLYCRLESWKCSND